MSINLALALIALKPPFEFVYWFKSSGLIFCVVKKTFLRFDRERRLFAEMSNFGEKRRRKGPNVGKTHQRNKTVAEKRPSSFLGPNPRISVRSKIGKKLDLIFFPDHRSFLWNFLSHKRIPIPWDLRSRDFRKIPKKSPKMIENEKSVLFRMFIVEKSGELQTWTGISLEFLRFWDSTQKFASQKKSQKFRDFSIGIFWENWICDPWNIPS